jgi:hypothetical protein
VHPHAEHELRVAKGGGQEQHRDEKVEDAADEPTVERNSKRAAPLTCAAAVASTVAGSLGNACPSSG